MSDIVWVVNPSRDSLHDLILRLKDTYSELLNSLGISIKAKNLEKLNNVKLPMDVKQNLYLIFKEAINNSIKHGNCKHITLEANFRNDVLEISVTDDGKGFDISASSQKRTLGILGMKERSLGMGGEYIIESYPGKGTSVREIIPIEAGAEN